MIEKIPEKLMRDSYIFKVSIDYGFFSDAVQKVEFYFEKGNCNKEENIK